MDAGFKVKEISVLQPLQSKGVTDSNASEANIGHETVRINGGRQQRLVRFPLTFDE